MQAIQILSRPEIQRLSLTLLHFVWQGVAVAIATSAVVFALGLRRGRGRYAAYLLGLAAMLTCPILTYVTLGQASDAGANGPDVSPPGIRTQLLDRPGLRSARPDISNGVAIAIAQPAMRTSLSYRGREWLAAALPWVPAAWAVGVIMLGARLLTGIAGVRRWQKGASDLPAPLLARVDQLAGRVGLPGFRRVYASPLVGQPSVIGFWRPVLILPLALVAQMPPDMLDAVIAHELAHLRRLDPLVNLAQRLVETLLFYHPAVWWLSGMIRREREICCDELASRVTGRMTYVSALEQVARFTLGICPAYAPGLALGFGSRRGQVLARIKHLLDLPSPRTNSAWPAGALALVMVVAGVGISRSAAQKPQSGPAAGRSDAELTPANTPAMRQARDGIASNDQLLTPVQDAKEQAREQAIRDERRAELDVQEAKIGLDAKKRDLDRVSSDKHLASQEELDRAQLAVSLGKIQLERTELELENAHARTQNFRPATVSIYIYGPADMATNGSEAVFSVRTRQITLEQLLNHEKGRLNENDKKGVGRLTLARKKENGMHKILDGVLVQEVLDGKVKDQPLQAGDEVAVKYEDQTAKEVVVAARDAPKGGKGGSWRALPQRNMTLTQVMAATNVDLKSIEDQKVVLIRKLGPQETTKVIDGIPLRDLLDGKAKDEIIQSGDRIEVSK